jgi:hypothetical protein
MSRPVGTEPVNGDALDRGMGDERVARRRAARDDVHDAGRERLGVELGERERRQAGLRRRLHHHRVARDERGQRRVAANITGWLKAVIRPTTP